MKTGDTRNTVFSPVLFKPKETIPHFDEVSAARPGAELSYCIILPFIYLAWVFYLLDVGCGVAMIRDKKPCGFLVKCFGTRQNAAGATPKHDISTVTLSVEVGILFCLLCGKPPRFLDFAPGTGCC